MKCVYKKILFYLMLADCACRGCAIVLLALLGEIHIPLFLVILSIAVTLLGIGLIVKYVRQGLRLNQLALFHLSAIICTLISLGALWFWPTDVSIFETLITGSLSTVILNGTLLALAYYKKHYITISQQSAQALPLPKEPALATQEKTDTPEE